MRRDLIVIFIQVVINVYGKTELTKRVFVKLEPRDLKEVKRELEHFRLRYIERVVPRLYIFKYEGKNPRDIDLRNIKYSSKGKILNMEHIVKHMDEGIPTPLPVTTAQPPTLDDILHPKNLSLFHSFLLTPRHGMGVEEAWKVGYTGHGVTIGITDVGVDVDLPDLAPNINHYLSINMFTGDTNVFPERYFSYKSESIYLTDHGNRCCGLIASRRDNTSCSVGIAHNASIVVIKLFSVPLYAWLPGNAKLEYTQDNIVKALSYKLQNIDIFSNSWATNLFHSFSRVEFDVELALEDGIKNGRDSKGAIYVFPAGPLAERYSNSLFTISVNSLDPDGGISTNFSEISATTLTSTFGVGSRINTTYMVTSSHDVLNCTKDFVGTSASTAMVSAMIGLALEANPRLTWRDVQHVIVSASNHQGLKETQNFKKNGAGHHYHNVFGFGLLNAFDLAMIANEWINVGIQNIQKEHSTNISPVIPCHTSGTKKLKSVANVNINCNHRHKRCCVDKVEHVIVTLSYTTPNERNLKLYITSPSNTRSLLMERGQSVTNSSIVRRNVQFLSVNFWNEAATGKWTVTAEQCNCQDNTEANFGITSFSLTIAGTQNRLNKQLKHHVHRNKNKLPCLKVISPEDNTFESDNNKSINNSSFHKNSFCIVLIVISMLIRPKRVMFLVVLYLLLITNVKVIHNYMFQD